MNRILLLASAASLSACATTPVDPLISPPDAAMAPVAAPVAAVPTVAPIPAKNPQLAAFFDAHDKAELALSPLSKAYRGIRDDDYGKWDQYTDEVELAYRELNRRAAAELQQRFDRASLSPEDQLSYDLFLSRNARQESVFPYNNYSYVFDQMNGAQSDGPAFLINIHKVGTVAEAEAYVSRLSEMARYLDQAIAEARQRETLGVLPPRWVFPLVISDARNIVTGAPFTRGKDSDLWADFKGKVDKLDTDAATKQGLTAAGRAAMLNDVRPAYQRVIALMQQQQKKAGNEDGIWRYPTGAAQYRALTASFTTTDLTPDQIHDLGLRHTKRIQDEMAAIKEKVGFKGTLQEFFEYARTDPRFFPKTREEYLSKTDAALKAMEAKLPAYFATLPKDPLVVKPVEPFREKTAGKAFYQSPAPDGSRPGTYYVSLYDLKAMSLNELEALAFHEGIPGHHLQRSIQTALGEVPPFRRFGGVTAYSEGWGLYSEELAKDMGFYTDPYSDFGRLSMEILRAGRLVVDTGIHSKRWSRQQAIDWFLANTPNAEGDVISQVERYVVYPGQATAYMIGKLKIMELREKARTQLGDRFDIKAYHDVVLKSGPVPLDILERRVDAWIASVRAS